jgi:hypothetical protein
MTGSDGPFNTIESAHEFLSLLGDQIDEALAEARLELADCPTGQPGRRVEAWQLVVYTITKVSFHIATSRRLVNDLRTLRNLLHRTGPVEPLHGRMEV